MSHVNPHAELLYTWYTLSPISLNPLALRCKGNIEKKTCLSSAVNGCKRLVLQRLLNHNISKGSNYPKRQDHISKCHQSDIPMDSMPCQWHLLSSLAWVRRTPRLGRFQAAKTAARQRRIANVKTWHPTSQRKFGKIIFIKYTRYRCFYVTVYMGSPKKRSCTKRS